MQRYEVAASRGMDLAIAYERARRPLVIHDISAGITTDLSDLLRSRGYRIESRISADLVSLGGAGAADRLIAVKTPGGLGGVTGLYERQLTTFEMFGAQAWLYVVFNVTQAAAAELWTVQDPARLPWRQEALASRPRGVARGTRHEGRFALELEAIHRFGTREDLRLLELPGWAGPQRD